jgi:hypothetical protein
MEQRTIDSSLMKTFTDTAKWDDKWFRGLTPATKIIYLYICDLSDHAGVWEFDGDMMRLHIGIKYKDDEIRSYIELLSNKIELLPNGKYWIKNYITFQNPKGISRKFKHCYPIYRSLEKNGIDPDRFSQATLDLESEGKESPHIREDAEESMKLWNNTCVGLPAVTRLTHKRKKAVQKIKKEGIALFELFHKVIASDFLMGRAKDSTWNCTFDWVLEVEHANKIMEDNYGTCANRRTLESEDFASGF